MTRDWEEHIRKNLINHPSDVNTEDLWNSIKDDLPERKSKKGSLLLLFVLFTLVSISYFSHSHISHHKLFQKKGSSFVMFPSYHDLNFNYKNKYNYKNSRQSLLNNKKTKQFLALSFNDVSSRHLLFNIEKYNSYSNPTSIKPLALNFENESSHLNDIDIAYAQLEINLPEVLASIDINKEEDIEELSLDKKKLKKNNNSNWSFALGARGGFGISNSIFNSKLRSITFYADMREDKEESMHATEIGVDALFILKNKWVFRTGISSLNIKECFNYKTFSLEMNSPSTNVEELETRHNYIEESSHQQEAEEEYNTYLNQSVMNEFSMTKQQINRYKYLSIPLTAAYLINDKNNKISLSLEGGALLSLRTKVKGIIAHSNRNYLDLSENYVYSKNINVLPYASIGIHYNVNNRLHFNTNFYTTATLGSITSRHYALSQKQMVIGMNSGFYYIIK